MVFCAPVLEKSFFHKLDKLPPIWNYGVFLTSMHILTTTHTVIYYLAVWDLYEHVETHSDYCLSTHPALQLSCILKTINGCFSADLKISCALLLL